MLLCNRCATLYTKLTAPCYYLNLTNLSQCQVKSLNQLTWTPRRYATTWKRRIIKQEQLKNVIFQYASKNTKPVDRVYVWGMTATGALGVRRFLEPEKHHIFRNKQLIPYFLDFFNEHRIVPHTVECGYGFTVFLCNTDSLPVVYGCGINTDSQLGFHESPRNSGRILDYLIQPTVINLPLLNPKSTKLLDVSCGRAHTVILTDKEGIFSLGNNSHGQCGRPRVDQELFRGSQQINRIHLDQKIVQVTCGQDHTLFLTEGGEVYSCGLGADGQTGLGHYEAVDKPSQVIGDIAGEKIVSLHGKADCVLAVSDKGDLFGWGNSEYGQLSLVAGDYTQIHTAKHLPFKEVGKVVKAVAGGSLCALLNADGQVYVWGYGILGKGPKLDQSVMPNMLPPALFGCNDFNLDQKVIDIQCGISHLAVLTASGELYMWGRNKSACLGMGVVTDQFFPFKVQVPAAVRRVSCGVDHTVALCKTFT